MSDIFPPQSDHPLFRYFEPEERKQIEELGRLVTVAKGGYLIRESQQDTALFTVERGRLEVLVPGEERLVATVGPGDVLGEVSFIDASPRSVSVRAGEETEVISWDRERLVDHLKDDAQLLAKFSLALSELLVERLRDSVRRQGVMRPM
ncbi:MAG: cyclic nucleotide-binding domain-containing protein [Thermoanaerobaculia bacterium]|nr:cyclic nucleotide-binding domain-containing protein [Thermoanaerobaculia bacterium]